MPSLGAVVLLTAVTLTGCSDTPSSSTATTTSTSSVAPISTTVAAATPVTIENHGPNSVPNVSVRHGVIAWGCNGAGFADLTAVKVQIALPTESTRHDIPIPAPGGEKLKYPRCATFGSGKDVTVVLADVVHKKSSGLEPESYVLTLFSYGLQSTSPIATSEVVTGTQPMTPIAIESSSEGVAVSYYLADDSHKAETHYYSGSNLAPGWTTEGSVESSTDKLFLLRSEPGHGNSVTTYAVVKAADGRPIDLGLANGNRPTLASDEGFAISWGTSAAPGPGRATRGLVWIDGSDIGAQGQTLDNAVSFNPDPASSLAIVGFKVNGAVSYKVIDRSTWQTKFEIDSAKVKGITLEELGIFDGNLYIINGNDEPVINATTGKLVHSGWDVFPVARANNITVVAKAADQGHNAGCVSTAFGSGDDPNDGIQQIGVYNCVSFLGVPDVDGKFPGPRY
jgi:hypothetical protein